MQNALGAPLEAGSCGSGTGASQLPALADGAEGVATRAGAGAPERRSSIQDLVGLTADRGAPLDGEAGQLRAAAGGGRLRRAAGGHGLRAHAALPVELHEGVHFVRGQVDGHERGHEEVRR